MKTRYKIGQLIMLSYIFLAFSALFIWQLSKHETINHFLWFVLFYLFLIYVVLAFFLRSPIISFDEDTIASRSFWDDKIYKWGELQEVFLSNKENYKLIFLFSQRLEATTLIFENGEKIILWNDMYSNLDKIRQMIVEKAKEKIRDPLPEIRKITLPFFGTKKYAGNPFLTANVLIVAVATFFILLQPGSKNMLLSVIIPFDILMLFLFSFQMNYFIIDNDNFIIRSHYFPWKNIVYNLNNIFEMDIETPRKRSRSLRILTKDYQSKLYAAGSLREKHWNELRNDLTDIGIPIRKD